MKTSDEETSATKHKETKTDTKMRPFLHIVFGRTKQLTVKNKKAARRECSPSDEKETA
jgi:hypothetical protein